MVFEKHSDGSSKCDVTPRAGSGGGVAHRGGLRRNPEVFYRSGKGTNEAPKLGVVRYTRLK